MPATRGDQFGQLAGRALVLHDLGQEPDAGAQCAIIGTPGNYSGANVPSNNGLATVAMTAGITLSAPAPITVQCSGTAQTSGENITAIPVTNLN
jgi:hypothetical protein